jgi:hypothetical protein
MNKHSPKKRQEVITRSGGVCNWCGSKDGLHLDHIHPRCRGGSNDAENLQLLCIECGQWKGRKMPQQILELLIEKSKNSSRWDDAVAFMRAWLKKHPQLMPKVNYVSHKKAVALAKAKLASGVSKHYFCGTCKSDYYGKMTICPVCKSNLVERSLWRELT